MVSRAFTATWLLLSVLPWGSAAAETAARKPEAPTTLFRIGQPDGACSEFGLTERRWPDYRKVFPKPIIYTVGKSPLTDWPYIHPSTADRWAGNQSHTFMVRFTRETPCRRPLFLIIGIADAHPTRPSEVTVTVNGTTLAGQRSPTGPGAVAHDPHTWGRPAAMVFAVREGLIRKGRNVVELNLKGGSYIVYDYVMLGTDPKPPNIAGGGETLLKDALAGPMAGVDEIIFACRQPGVDGHWYANFGYYAPSTDRKTYRAMGRLCKLNIRTGKITVLLDDPEGSIRDPQVHYDGQKIVFSYRKGGSESFGLYEINVDGTGLRQLTDGAYDDIEPTYLPDGGIAFCSSRCNRWVNCWLTPVAILYRCDGDGKQIRPISGNINHDNTPWVLPDGRLLYQRWEYVDRSQVHYHHLWTANPDGTGQMVYYGNMHPGIVMIDAKPIPGTDKVVVVFSPGHGRREHAGVITIVTPKAGPDAKASATRVSRGGDYRDPYPFSEDCFLVAYKDRLQVMDGRGNTRDIYRLPPELGKAGVECHEPRPLRPRPRERVIAPRVDLKQATGRLVLTDVYRGRRMEGVRRGEIKKLLVLESLPKPINFTGGMEPLSYGGTFTLERILGTVPVEPDGSAFMEVPAMRSLLFVALDERGHSVKRMQSFLTVMPGETTGCVGCHEQRTRTPANRGRNALAALNRPPSAITPLKDVPAVFDFPRDIQPILDTHCIECHNPDRREDGVLLTGDRGPMFSHSYYMLAVREQVADGRNRPRSNYPPRALGSAASPLMKKIDGSHYDVKPSDHERKMIRLWIETGGPYPGTYAALGTGMIGGYAQNVLDRSDTKWPSMKAAMEVLERRCGTCHTGPRRLPTSPTDNMSMPPWAIRYGDPRLRFSRHILYNLTRPEKSVLLLGPLSKQAGGYGMCKHEGKRGTSTSRTQRGFADTADPDYQKLLTAIRDTKRRLDEVRRFDMPGFRPRRGYVREMKKYGILPRDLAEDAVIDVYKTDRAYWRSHWWQPVSNDVAEGSSARGASGSDPAQDVANDDPSPETGS